ncbi:MAG: hypothetical protein ACRDZ2_05685 [Ilumatobacteraceae bacterium]
MATITITKVRCRRPQDITGKDEPVIRLGGQDAWEGKLGKDESDYPNESRGFSPSILLELQERNGLGGKQLGRWTISETAVTGKKLTASSSGFHYEVTYSVS